MSKNNTPDCKQENKAEEQENSSFVDPATIEEATEEVNADAVQAENEADITTNKIDDLEKALEKEKKEYLFLMAEFDNFRKRTLKEKSELVKTAGEQSLKGMLPILDDFERGLKAAADATDVEAVREGMELIYNKFIKYLDQNGVKAMDPEERDFDTEKHEAISVVPVPDKELKGKILDTVQKGYTINGKVMRHAKVVVGQ